jgi:hypothetical protein
VLLCFCASVLLCFCASVLLCFCASVLLTECLCLGPKTTSKDMIERSRGESGAGAGGAMDRVQVVD